MFTIKGHVKQKLLFTFLAFQTSLYTMTLKEFLFAAYIAANQSFKFPGVAKECSAIQTRSGRCFPDLAIRLGRIVFISLVLCNWLPTYFHVKWMEWEWFLSLYGYTRRIKILALVNRNRINCSSKLFKVILASLHANITLEICELVTHKSVNKQQPDSQRVRT